MAKLTYLCPCGVSHLAGAWAAAHWSEELTHTCDACGRLNTIRNGWVLRSKKPRQRQQARHKIAEGTA